jgi:plastocyanin
MMLAATRLCVASFLAVACSAACSQTHVIAIEGMRFSPESLTINRGDRVAWENKDLFPHTVTAGAKAFDSSDMAPQASWAYVASTPGEYAYHCTYHPTMTARLVVR